ncbi:MAG: thioredoxin family protein [Ignavibacteriae bacterium]|nr:thioredoxin family protein [Ignavibacteriota bacterium]
MLLQSKPGEINSSIIDFQLKNIDNRIYSLNDFSVNKILVIIFICNHCPYVKAVIGRLVAIHDKNISKGVQLIGINPNDTKAFPEDSFENMKLFAKEYSMNFPYLFDETQTTAKQYDAVCTPDIYVFDEKRILKYRGRIDDNWKDEEQVTSKDLESASELLIEGKDISFEQIPSMGCSIKWK